MLEHQVGPAAHDPRAVAAVPRRASPGSAASAASSARRVSAAPMRGTRASSSPVAGFVTANVSPESASTHSPPSHACERRKVGPVQCDRFRTPSGSMAPSCTQRHRTSTRRRARPRAGTEVARGAGAWSARASTCESAVELDEDHACIVGFARWSRRFQRRAIHCCAQAPCDQLEAPRTLVRVSDRRFDLVRARPLATALRARCGSRWTRSARPGCRRGAESDRSRPWRCGGLSRVLIETPSVGATPHPARHGVRPSSSRGRRRRRDRRARPAPPSTASRPSPPRSAPSAASAARFTTGRSCRRRTEKTASPGTNLCQSSAPVARPSPDRGTRLTDSDRSEERHGRRCATPSARLARWCLASRRLFVAPSCKSPAIPYSEPRQSRSSCGVSVRRPSSSAVGRSRDGAQDGLRACRRRG